MKLFRPCLPVLSALLARQVALSSNQLAGLSRAGFAFAPAVFWQHSRACTLGRTPFLLHHLGPTEEIRPSDTYVRLFHASEIING